MSIFEQLQLEEALLRAADQNFCITNIGSPRTIVMGISGDPSVHLDLPRVRQDHIPIVQRFSGGGTVIVDESTLLTTFIFSKEALNIPAFPEPILHWSTDLYTAAWRIPAFRLAENDYIIHNHKCGGNAQYIQKGRWLHHTSFLWDYSPQNMHYLHLPPKRPKYRQDRPHEEFLCRLKDHTPHDPHQLITSLEQELSKQFDLIPLEGEGWQDRPHRKTTKYL